MPQPSVSWPSQGKHDFWETRRLIISSPTDLPSTGLNGTRCFYLGSTSCCWESCIPSRGGRVCSAQEDLNERRIIETLGIAKSQLHSLRPYFRVETRLPGCQCLPILQQAEFQVQLKHQIGKHARCIGILRLECVDRIPASSCPSRRSST